MAFKIATLCRKSTTIAQRLGVLPSWPSAVEVSTLKSPVSDTLESHQFAQQAALIRQFSSKKSLLFVFSQLWCNWKCPLLELTH